MNSFGMKVSTPHHPKKKKARDTLNIANPVYKELSINYVKLLIILRKKNTSARDKSILNISHIAKALVYWGCWPRCEQFPITVTVTLMFSGCVILQFLSF